MAKGAKFLDEIAAGSPRPLRSGASHEESSRLACTRYGIFDQRARVGHLGRLSQLLLWRLSHGPCLIVATTTMERY